ncbi:MAG: flagellar biosynthesis repressor FlbT [Siculibacillus sp.]
MTLKVEIKPGERIIIGESLITNGSTRARLFIEGDAPILREKDVLPPREADTPAKLIYLAVQLMYLKQGTPEVIEDYRSLVRDFQEAAPGAQDILSELDNCILTGDFYKGVKHAKRLIAYEELRIHHV